MKSVASDLPQPIGLRHLALRVRDVRASEEFYCGLLGFEIEWRPDPDNLYLKLGADSLALHHEGFQAGPGALHHLGVAFASAEDLRAWAANLAARGVTLQQELRQHRDGATSCTILDPDGNAVQLIHHPPISELERAKP
jgi:catechol 2,3-dioxygenase-like lactoylglutathione lyase family enzyme